MNSILFVTVKAILIIILAPLAGGILAGVDRKISARMQSRQGPPLLQPFYDVLKLMQKKSVRSSSFAHFFVIFSLFFTILTVVLFFLGSNFLLCIFSFTLACVFFVLAGYSSYSPYGIIGAERELLQIMCYEPMILIFAFGFYYVTGDFSVKSVISQNQPIIVKLPLIFLGFITVLTVKLRKSPFDLSMSHHGHQEIVKGITTELTGPTLAFVEIMHWYESIFAMGLVFIFFISSSPLSYLLAIIATVFIYFTEIIVDNSFARYRWQKALQVSWGATLLFGVVNLIALSILNTKGW